MITVKRNPVHFEYDVIYYVPVFQKNFEANGELCGYPTFSYYMGDATQDEQMAWSMEPDYVFELCGHFDATTKPLVLKCDDE